MRGVLQIFHRLTKWQWSPAHSQPFVLILQLDAWNIRERNDWGQTKTLRKKGKEPERPLWVYTATLFRLDQRGHTASHRPVISERGCVATRFGLEIFEHLVYAQALRKGPTRAAEVLVIADGAAWIWNLVENRFRRATWRADLYHVKQHLWAVAGELYDQDKDQARQRLINLVRGELRQAGGPRMIDAVESDILQIAHAFFAKGSPQECAIVCKHALRHGRATPAGLQNYCDTIAKIGLDCSGYVDNYFITIGKISGLHSISQYARGR